MSMPPTMLTTDTASAVTSVASECVTRPTMNVDPPQSTAPKIAFRHAGFTVPMVLPTGGPP